MIELDEATRQALLARDGPPPGTSEQILGALRMRLGVPGSGGPGEGGGPEPLGGDGSVLEPLIEPLIHEAGRAAWAAKIVGATVGLTGAGLLVLKVGALVLGGIGSDAPRTDAPTQTQIESQEPAQALGDHDIAPALVPVPDAAPRPISSANATSIRASEPGSSVVSADTDDVDTSSDLAAEVALLREAKQLRPASPEAALDQLERHREQFPSGTLASERDALRVELLCTLGRISEAEAARGQFAIAHPGSPLRARVEAECLGTDPERGGD
jgi:hypothetical protein